MSIELNNREYLLLRGYEAGIRDRRELAIFMGQMEVESGGFQRMHENLNYRAERLIQVFPDRNGINSLAQAKAIARGGPESVANAIYGGDWGLRNLGNTEPGDGWRFHGRGYVQLTGRVNYERVERELGLGVTANPDLAADRHNAASIAIHYWQDRVVTRGHQNDVRAATHDINGGHNHLAQRRAAVAQWERMLTPEVMDRLSRGDVVLPSLKVAQQNPAVGSTLRLGERGPEVRALQQTLIRLGFREAGGHDLKPDGHFGVRTEEAVRAFQCDYGLHEDGIAGQRVRATLERADRLAKVPVSMTDGVLRQGVRGAEVRLLQESLGKLGYPDAQGNPVPADGHFGPRTGEALRAFQHDHGLKADGIAGQKTWSAIDRIERMQVSHVCHGDHPLFLQAQAGVHKLDAQHQRTPDQRSDQLAAALVVAAKTSGLHQIDDVLLGKNGESVGVVQRGLHGVFDRYAFVETVSALSQSIARSSEQLAQVNQEQARQATLTELQRQQPPERSQGFSR